MECSVRFVPTNSDRALLDVAVSYMPVFQIGEIIDLEIFDRNDYSHKTVYKLDVISIEHTIIVQSVVMHQVNVIVEVLTVEVS